MSWYEEPFWWICKLSISITLFLTHCFTAFSWLLSQWSTTWLSVTFIFPFILKCSYYLTNVSIHAWLLRITLGCDRPSSINFDLENISWYEWVPSFFRNLVHIANNSGLWQTIWYQFWPKLTWISAIFLQKSCVYCHTCFVFDLHQQHQLFECLDWFHLSGTTALWNLILPISCIILTVNTSFSQCMQI